MQVDSLILGVGRGTKPIGNDCYFWGNWAKQTPFTRRGLLEDYWLEGTLKGFGRWRLGWDIKGWKVGRIGSG